MSILTMRPDINSMNYGLRALIELAKFKVNPKSLVEIGCYRGESTDLFAKSFTNLKDLFAVDPWKEGYDPDDPASSSSMEEVYQDFVKRMSWCPFLTIYRDTSENVSAKALDNTIDMIYIDGDHRAKAVKKDIELWLPKIVSGGIISGHDYGGEVKMVVDEKFRSKDIYSFSDSSWAVVL